MKRASILGRESLPRKAEVGILLAVLIVALGLHVAYLHVAEMGKQCQPVA